MDGMKLLVIAAVIPLMLAQASWLYADARHHSRYPWFWACWGLVQCPLPLVFYWFFVRRKATNKGGRSARG